jgi:hypothetical protein
MKPDAIETLLEADHESIEELIAQLSAALEGQDAEQAFARLDLVWARLAVHIRAEHLCLFPALLDAARQPASSSEDSTRFEEAQSVISQLRHDHDFFMVELARAVNALRGVMCSQNSEAVKECLREVRRMVSAITVRLAEHNELEEEQVYLWPAVLFDSTRQTQLAECARRELQNMPSRFA